MKQKIQRNPTIKKRYLSIAIISAAASILLMFGLFNWIDLRQSGKGGIPAGVCCLSKVEKGINNLLILQGFQNLEGLGSLIAWLIVPKMSSAQVSRFTDRVFRGNCQLKLLKDERNIIRTNDFDVIFM